MSSILTTYLVIVFHSGHINFIAKHSESLWDHLIVDELLRIFLVNPPTINNPSTRLAGCALHIGGRSRYNEAPTCCSPTRQYPSVWRLQRVFFLPLFVFQNTCNPRPFADPEAPTSHSHCFLNFWRSSTFKSLFWPSHKSFILLWAFFTFYGCWRFYFFSILSEYLVITSNKLVGSENYFLGGFCWIMVCWSRLWGLS